MPIEEVAWGHPHLIGQVLSAVSRVKAWPGENVPRRGGKEKTNTLYSLCPVRRQQEGDPRGGGGQTEVQLNLFGVNWHP